MLTGMRIVSLLPSATEIVYSLGLDDDLVGVTFECDEPPTARQDKAVVVGGRDTSAMTPAEIDAFVRSRMAAGADLYTLRVGALSALDPDLILTQDLCRVCAIPSGDVQDALNHLGCRADVIALDPHTLTDPAGGGSTRCCWPAATPSLRRRVGRPPVHGRALGARSRPGRRRQTRGSKP
jgi:iron complex transport system substrate-binding protein